VRKTVVIASSYDEVPLVGAALRELCDGSAIGEGEAAMYELAVVEAVNNAIEHAYAEGSGPVEVSVEISPDEVVVVVTDCGKPGDAAKINARPVEPEVVDREHLSEGGRGLAIIHGVFDEVEFSTSDSHNSLRLRKRRGGA
jgi:serine/threonine-protein kinase RsbW